MSGEDSGGECSERTPLTARTATAAPPPADHDDASGVPLLLSVSSRPPSWAARYAYPLLYLAVLLLLLGFCAALWSPLPSSSSSQAAAEQLEPSAPHAQPASREQAAPRAQAGSPPSLQLSLQSAAHASSSSSSSSCQSARQLQFSCLGNALGGLEHGAELVGSHSLSGLYAIVSAQLLAAASQRRLYLNTTGCAMVRNMRKGEARDAGLLCCDWQRYLQPLPPCEPPTSARADADPAAAAASASASASASAAAAAAAAASLHASAFSAAANVSFDASQQCLWDDELWPRLRILYPQQSQLQLVQAVTRSLLRPSASFARRLSALEARMPASPAGAPPLLVHIPPLPPCKQKRIARTQPAAAFINAIRYGSSASNVSSLLLIAGSEQVQEVSAALRHLQVTDVLAVLSEYWAARAKPQLEQAVAMSLVLLSASLAERWLGLWSSVLPQLALLASPRAAVPQLADLEGEVWTASCWSMAPHVFRAEHTPPPGFSIPAMAALLSSSPSSPRAPLPMTQLVLVLGNDLSSVAELERLLLRSSAFSLQPSPQLSAAYSALFADLDVHYPSGRALLVSRLTALAGEPTSRVLLSFTPSDSWRERALTYYQQASLLASLLSSHSLPLSLRVVVLATRPDPLLGARLLQLQSSANDSLLPEGKVLRDLLSGVEAELKVMDASLWRVFQHERLFHTDVEEEGRSLARWLQLGVEEEEQAVVDLKQMLQERKMLLFPQQARLPEVERQAVSDLFAAARSMRLFHSVPNSSYDYHRSAQRALQQRSSERKQDKDSQRPELTSAAHIHRLQLGVERGHGDGGRCASVRLLVFDGFGDWAADSSSASSQLLQLLQSLSLALAAGRVLLVPALAGSVTDFLQPLSDCSLETVDMKVVQSEVDGWQLEGAGMTVAGNDPLGEERVVVGRGDVLDVAYLAAWNAQLSDSSHYLSVHDWLGELLRFILRPANRLAAAVQDDAGDADAAVLVPTIVSQPLSWYVSLISALVTSRSLRRLQISASLTTFQHAPSPSFLPFLELDSSPAQSQHATGDAMVEAISQHLRAAHPGLELTAKPRTSGQHIEQELRELLQASRAPLIVGSMGSVSGFLLAALMPPPAWLDFFAYHFVSSLLALNAHSLRSGRQQLRPLSSVPAPVLNKTVESARCRFVYVAGLEGTGHHTVGHLLASTRRFNGSTLLYDWLDSDRPLASHIWEMFRQSQLQVWKSSRRLLAARIGHLLQQRCRPRADGFYPTFIVNTLQENLGGMQSWPNFNARDKASLHTSLPVLAALFQEQGADFRVLVLTRSAGSLLASTTLHRNFGASIVGRRAAFLYEARVLRSNLASLDSDLQAIDQRFVLKLAMNQLSLDPLLFSRGLAAHLALAPSAARELEQATLWAAEKMAGSHPEDQWMNDMTEAQMTISYDMLGLSLSLPITADFRFVAGSVGGSDVETARGCRRRSFTLRQEARQATLAGLQYGGLEYASALIEESTAIITSRHSFDHTLSPSSVQHLARYTAQQLVSAELLEASIKHSSGDSPPIPTVLLTRNPLDIALSAAFSSLQHGGFAAASKLWDSENGKIGAWLEANRPRVDATARQALRQVGEAYTRWAKEWQVARRRQETLERGSSGDGVVVLRLEDLIASDSALPLLLRALHLIADAEAARCVSDVSRSLPRPARLLSTPASFAATRTASGQYALNVSVSALQQRLLSCSALAHSSAWFPFSLLSLLPADAFAAFRSTVDAAATAIEGDDWRLYCQQVEALQAQQPAALAAH